MQGQGQGRDRAGHATGSTYRRDQVGAVLRPQRLQHLEVLPSRCAGGGGSITSGVYSCFYFCCWCLSCLCLCACHREHEARDLLHASALHLQLHVPQPDIQPLCSSQCERGGKNR